MTKLSVNINKIATLRNARGGNNPDVLKVAQDCEAFGAEGITVHPRPDERHIRWDDVLGLKEVVGTELNIEGYPDQRYLKLVAATKPEQATLVPDPPDALTSNAGWDAVRHQEKLKDLVSELKELGAGRVSIFLGTEMEQLEAAAETGCDRVEFYTEPYALMYAADRQAAVAPFASAAKKAEEIGLGCNAGHDLDLDNLAWLAQNLPQLQEVSIGHALVCDALYFGLENTIGQYLRQLDPTQWKKP